MSRDTAVATGTIPHPPQFSPWPVTCPRQGDHPNRRWQPRTLRCTALALHSVWRNPHSSDLHRLRTYTGRHHLLRNRSKPRVLGRIDPTTPLMDRSWHWCIPLPQRSDCPSRTCTSPDQAIPHTVGPRPALIRTRRQW